MQTCFVMTLWCAFAAHGSDATTATDEPAMMFGVNGWRTAPLLTVGESIDDGDGGLYQLTGRLDGIGAIASGPDTVRIYVNHEIKPGDGTPWSLANGATLPSGSRLSWIDIDVATHNVVAGGSAIEAIVDGDGVEVTHANVDDFTELRKLCSSSMYGPQDGFDSFIYFAGEEWSGGRAFFLDVATGTYYEAPDLGNGFWENVSVIPTNGAVAEGKTVIILADDTFSRPAYLYVGDKVPGSKDFLARHGLSGGSLYAFRLDSGANTNTEFDGTGAFEIGTWIPIPNDPGADDVDNMNAMVDAAAIGGAFFFSRPEDVASDPITPETGRVVFASTGHLVNLGDIDDDGDSDIVDDPWGTMYMLTVDLDSLDDPVITGSIEVIRDGNEPGAGDMGLRNPDNLDWTETDLVYVQEDKTNSAFGQTSDREASVWQLDPATAAVTHLAEMDRDAIPDGLTDEFPTIIGEWESSGILDVSELFGEAPDTLFVLDVQAHSITDGYIETDDLVESGQLLFLRAPVATCSGDINEDGVVDVVDLLAMLSSWGPCPACAADVDGSGAVDVGDLLEIIAVWGPCS